jgi:hypothetical protein
MTAPDGKDAQRLGQLIPRTIGPWLSEADEVYDGETIFDYIDGAGEVYRSYNMRLVVARRFHKDGKPDIVVDLFDMGSSADAFGVFTHDLEGEDAGIGQGSTYKGGLLSFWKDRYFGSVYAEEETPETKGLVLELGRLIAAAVPKEGPKPALLAALPVDGLATGRVRFFHTHLVLNYHFFVADTNILLLDQTTKAVLAPYDRGKGKSHLLLIDYGGAGKAAAARDSFAAAYMPEAAKKEIVRTENGKWTAVRAAGSVVAVIFDAASEAGVVAFLDEIEANLKKNPL